MSESSKKVANLIAKYLNGSISSDDVRALDQWRSESTENEGLFQKLTSEEYVMEGIRERYLADKLIASKIRERLQQEQQEDEPGTKKSGKVLMSWMMAAAATLLLVLSGLYFFFNQNSSLQVARVADKEPAGDLPAPQHNRATIKLEDGRTIYLDSADNRLLLTAGNIDVVKLEDGTLTYNRKAAEEKGKVVWNTLTNPRGSRVIDVTLSDGSRVWLNSESSITFPVAFTNDERQVQISGEAYFEVKKDAGRPFKVLNKDYDLAVKVLGTRFNVNTFNEGPAEVTLLEGKVEVVKQSGGHSRMLSPGMQAQTGQTGKIGLNERPDIERVMAWKNGLFLMSNTDIHDILIEIERWYDAKIVYKDDVSGRFSGEISRNEPVSKILMILELTKGVSFEVVGNTIYVRKGDVSN